MRRRAATALIDAVLCKRGIFKTGWNAAEDRPVTRVIDPSAVFFDMTVRDVEDIRYWLEATVVPYSEFKALSIVVLPNCHPLESVTNSRTLVFLHSC